MVSHTSVVPSALKRSSQRHLPGKSSCGSMKSPHSPPSVSRNLMLHLLGLPMESPPAGTISLVTDISSLNSNSDPLLPLETVTLIPQLTGLHHPSDTIRKLLSLPYRLGGLNITNPCTHLPSQYQFSRQICSPLIDYYFSNSTGSDITDCLGRQQEIKSTITFQHHDSLVALASYLKDHLDPSTQYSIDLCTEKGASNWVSALPWFSPPQICFQRCYSPALRMGYPGRSISLHLWPTFLPRPCLIMSCWRVSIYPP